MGHIVLELPHQDSSQLRGNLPPRLTLDRLDCVLDERPKQSQVNVLDKIMVALSHAIVENSA
jgi:hypothetical protein